MPRNPVEVAEFQKEVGKKLVDFFNDRVVKMTILPEFNGFLQYIKNKIFVEKKKPFAPLQDIPADDLEFYQRAYRFFFGKVGETSFNPETGIVDGENLGGARKLWQERLNNAQKITTNIETQLNAGTSLTLANFREKITQAITKLKQALETNGLLTEEIAISLSIAAALLIKKIITNTRKNKEFSAKSENLLGVWQLFKQYKSDKNLSNFNEDIFFNQAHHDLGQPISGGGRWHNPDVKQLFIQAGELDDLLEKAKKGTLSANEMSRINGLVLLLEHSASISQTGVSETEIVYHRLKEKYDFFVRELHSRLSPGLVDSTAEKLASTGEDKDFKNYSLALNKLLKKLADLQQKEISLHNISPADKKELEELLTTVRAGAKFNNDSDVPAPTQNILQTIYKRVELEASAILGDLLEEDPSIFSDDVIYWLMGSYNIEWREVQRYWALLQADNQALITDHDKRKIAVLIEDFKKALKDLVELQKDDVAFVKRFIAIDVQLNRLQKLQGVKVEADLPEQGLPMGFELPENTVGGWEQYYLKVSEALGPKFLKNQARELRQMLEDQNITHSFQHAFLEEKRHDGLRDAMRHYKGVDEAEIHELAKLLEMNKILFEAQAAPSHSWSMTCDVDQLPDWEANGVDTGLFDYFTLEDGEARSGEKRYKYSHYIRRLVGRLVEILYEQPIINTPPQPGDFVSRDHGGSAFNADGTPQKGWFEYSHWKDTAENKQELLKRMQYELRRDIAPNLDAEDVIDVAFFAHRIASVTGIREDLFAPYFASGATPVDMLGDNSKYIGQVNLFAPELYSPYKKRIYLQLAEMIEIPQDWWERMKTHKKSTPIPRMRDVKRAFDVSRLLASTMSKLREPFVIPILDDGIRMRNTYSSMFDLFFTDEVRDKRRRESVTLKAWKRGKTEFISFKEMCFDTPGGVDVNNITQYSKEDLIKHMVDYVDKLINTGLSYMKKNYSLAQWRDMAILVRWSIDRCFRVYALRDESFKGSRKLLKEIRARLDQANTIHGVGKIRRIDDLQEIVPGIGLDPNGVITGLASNINVRKAQIQKLEEKGVILSPLLKNQHHPIAKVLDIREFLLESYPDWQLVDFQTNSFKIPRSTRSEMSIVMPAVQRLAWVVRPVTKLDFILKTSDLLTNSEFTYYKGTAATGIFGRKPPEQQKAPDEEKKG